jgi:hypothetical protein
MQFAQCVKNNLKCRQCTFVQLEGAGDCQMSFSGRQIGKQDPGALRVESRHSPMPAGRSVYFTRIHDSH